MKKLKTLLVFAACLVAIASCKKEAAVVEPISHSNTSGSFELLQKKVLTKSCDTNGCHASEADVSFKQHKLVLTGADLYTRLINGSVANSKAVSAGLKQIVPKDADKSFFYQKVIFSKSAHQYGNAMPLGADALTDKKLQFIKDWIVAGAPEKGHVADEELLLH